MTIQFCQLTETNTLQTHAIPKWMVTSETNIVLFVGGLNVNDTHAFVMCSDNDSNSWRKPYITPALQEHSVTVKKSRAGGIESLILTNIL